MVSYQWYEGDISITLCRTQTLCPVNVKYLQGRERVCVLNVCSTDLILFVTGVCVALFYYTDIGESLRSRDQFLTVVDLGWPDPHPSP